MSFPEDRLVLTPDDIDLSRSPLAGRIDAETYVLGAFNPAMTRLPNGNLLLMVRVAEALKEPIHDDEVHAIRWDAEHGYVLDGWPLELKDMFGRVVGHYAVDHLTVYPNGDNGVQFELKKLPWFGIIHGKVTLDSDAGHQTRDIGWFVVAPTWLVWALAIVLVLIVGMVGLWLWRRWRWRRWAALLEDEDEDDEDGEFEDEDLDDADPDADDFDAVSGH